MAAPRRLGLVGHVRVRLQGGERKEILFQIACVSMDSVTEISLVPERRKKKWKISIPPPKFRFSRNGGRAALYGVLVGPVKYLLTQFSWKVAQDSIAVCVCMCGAGLVSCPLSFSLFIPYRSRL